MEFPWNAEPGYCYKVAPISDPKLASAVYGRLSLRMLWATFVEDDWSDYIPDIRVVADPSHRPTRLNIRAT